MAIGLARLGHHTALMARLADNALGRMLRDHAAAEGVDLTAAPLASQPTTLAVVSLDPRASASYDFYLDGTADWHWTERELARAPERMAVLHFGSIASWTAPGDALILALAERVRERGDVLVSYDPNVRPGLLADHERARGRIERAVGLAHLAKASADDIAWLYPELTASEVAGRWLRLGAALVVITGSARGADAFTGLAGPVHRPVRPVAVADTVGAGDSFTAGLIGRWSGGTCITRPGWPGARPGSCRPRWTTRSSSPRSTASGQETIRRRSPRSAQQARPDGGEQAMPPEVGLIAYADRFGGTLAGLNALLDGPLRGLFGGVHVLPLLPSVRRG